MTREQMARYMNLNPSQPQTWPLKTIDNLISIYEAKGHEALTRVLFQMFSPR